VIPSTGHILDACEPNEETELCESSFDHDKVQAFLEEKCMDQRECQFNILDVLPMKDGAPECTNKLAQFYAQVFCQHSDEEMEWRIYINQYLTVQILVVALIYSFFIVLIKINSSKKYNEWDMVTTTIADYNVSYRIPDEEYDHYKENVFPNSGHRNVNYGFMCYLKEEFERILHEQDEVVPGANRTVEISHIYFQFKNKEVIDMMLSRGNALRNGVIWDQVKYEMQMKEYIQENEEMLTRPVEAYLTCATEETF
jgi:hypothetical protein